jgi:hypothetical protein
MYMEKWECMMASSTLHLAIFQDPYMSIPSTTIRFACDTRARLVPEELSITTALIPRVVSVFAAHVLPQPPSYRCLWTPLTNALSSTGLPQNELVFVFALPFSLER